MRLVTVTHFFESHRGGIEIVAGRLARELARRGNEVVWAATDASGPPADDTSGLVTVRLRASNVTERRIGVPYPLPGLRSVAALFRAVKAADAVLVHDALYLTSIAGLMAARVYGKPAVVVQHIGAVPYRDPLLRGLMRIANRLVARPLLARADQTVFISELTAAHFAGARYRNPPELIFNGVDIDTFFPPRDPDETRAARERHGLPHGPRVALFVGRFVEKKGLPVLERLARTQPHVLFAFAGWGQCDPRWWALPNVRVFDDLQGEGLASLYRASDALVLPSSGEGFPLVIQEALACGLPVVCGSETAKADPATSPLLTAVPVLPEDTAGTAARFGEALTQVLSTAADSAARDRRFDLVRDRYSWPRAAARYAEILTNLTNAERRGRLGHRGVRECGPVRDVR